MSLTTIVLTVFLLAANAFFVGAEFAAMSARRSQLEPLAEGDRIVGPVFFGQLADGPEDQLMVTTVEVGIDQLVGNAIVRVRGEHQAAEHRLFGFDRLRRNPQLLDTVVRATVERMRFGTQSLACAHQWCDSPVRTVIAILLL